MREVVVVSGLPRSGTSMMMRMLGAGGLEILTDEERTADEDNPRGYFELEAVKRTEEAPRWLEGTGGKVVKVISQLLPSLPEDRRYKVVFMRRRLDEVLASQKRMLDRRGEEQGEPDEAMKGLFASHLEEIEAWLRRQDHMDVLYVSYNRTVQDPQKTAERLGRFLGEGILDLEAAVRAVEPDLYRNRA